MTTNTQEWLPIPSYDYQYPAMKICDFDSQNQIPGSKNLILGYKHRFVDSKIEFGGDPQIIFWDKFEEI